MMSIPNVAINYALSKKNTPRTKRFFHRQNYHPWFLRRKAKKKCLIHITKRKKERRKKGRKLTFDPLKKRKGKKNVMDSNAPRKKEKERDILYGTLPLPKNKFEGQLGLGRKEACLICRRNHFIILLSSLSLSEQKRNNGSDLLLARAKKDRKRKKELEEIN